MKKAAVIALASIVIVIVVSLLVRSERDAAPDGLRPNPVGSSNEQGSVGESEGDNPKIRPVENPDISIVGRKPYDTGIKNDQRIQHREDGMHVATEGIQIANSLHSNEGSTEEDLDYIEQILGIYRLSFESNPVAGDNRSVMRALLGENPRNLVVFPENHPALNAKGELLDRWGTPYFFHALSGTEMEIFSAGPDGEFNTADDVQRSFRDGQPLTGQEPTPELDVDL